MDKDSMRVQITMPVDLVAEIDQQAKKINLSRSSFITMVVTQYSNQQKIISDIDDIKKWYYLTIVSLNGEFNKSEVKKDK